MHTRQSWVILLQQAPWWCKINIISKVVANVVRTSCIASSVLGNRTKTTINEQGFWYFARSRSRKIQVNPRNTAKFTKTQKIPQNLVEILSNTCLYNIYAIGAIYLPWTCKFILEPRHWKVQTPGIDYVAKNWALAMMLKALPLVHFWSVLLSK